MDSLREKVKWTVLLGLRYCAVIGIFSGASFFCLLCVAIFFPPIIYFLLPFIVIEVPLFTTIIFALLFFSMISLLVIGIPVCLMYFSCWSCLFLPAIPCILLLGVIVGFVLIPAILILLALVFPYIVVLAFVYLLFTLTNEYKELGLKGGAASRKKIVTKKVKKKLESENSKVGSIVVSVCFNPFIVCSLCVSFFVISVTLYLLYFFINDIVVYFQFLTVESTFEVKLDQFTETNNPLAVGFMFCSSTQFTFVDIENVKSTFDRETIRSSGDGLDYDCLTYNYQNGKFPRKVMVNSEVEADFWIYFNSTGMGSNFDEIRNIDMTIFIFDEDTIDTSDGWSKGSVAGAGRRLSWGNTGINFKKAKYIDESLPTQEKKRYRIKEVYPVTYPYDSKGFTLNTYNKTVSSELDLECECFGLPYRIQLSIGSMVLEVHDYLKVGARDPWTKLGANLALFRPVWTIVFVLILFNLCTLPKKALMLIVNLVANKVTVKLFNEPMQEFATGDNSDGNDEEESVNGASDVLLKETFIDEEESVVE